MKTYWRKSLICNSLVIIGGLLVLVGWQYNIPALKTIVPGFISMKANTAIGLIFLALGGLISSSTNPTQPRRAAVVAISALVFTLAVATMLEYSLQSDFGIDELLYRDPDAMATRWPPGRFAPVTAINFILLSLSLFLDELRWDRSQKTQQGLILVAWMISFQAFVGYLAGVTYSFGSAFYTQIAVHTAALFILLCTALLWARPNGGFLAKVLGPGLPGRVGRRLLTAAILAPPIINWVQMAGMKAGIWDSDFGILLRVLGNVGIFAWIAFQTTYQLDLAQTQREQAYRRELEQSTIRQSTETRMSLIADAVPAFISYVDASGRYRFANAAYQSWFGLTPNEVLGKTLPDVLGASFTKAGPYLDQVLAGNSVRYRNSVVAPSGQERFFEADYIPDKSSAGTVNGFVIIGHDVTERTLAESALEAAVRARDDLISICSHELRTPIASMKLSTQIVKRSLDSGAPDAFSKERVVKMVAQADRQLNRLTRLIEDMLDFTRISGGRLMLNPSQFDLSELAAEVMERMASQIEMASVSSNLVTHGPLFGSWDRFRLDQVITNLISNAIKYGSGKPFTVEVGTETLANRQSAVIFVRDQGIGVLPEDQQRIFKPYERAVGINNISGLGLGLFISSEIVEAHAGRLELTSDLGQGSEFKVRLPLTTNNGMTAPGAAPGS